MSNGEDTLTFYFENEAGSRTDKNIRRNQVTIDRLALLFKLIPSSIYIVEEFDDFAIDFPMGNGTFSSVVRALPGTVFKVEGDPRQTRISSEHSLPVPSLPTNSNRANQTIGAFRQNNNLPGPSRRRSVDQYALKIVLAEVVNRRIGEHLRQNYINISEATANVESITQLVREYYEDAELVLVQKNCLLYEDLEATRTMQFWKNTSRKIYAVKETSLNQQESTPPANGQTPVNLQNVLSELQTITRKIERYESSREAIDIAMRAFRCLVCYSVASSNDVVIAGCCRQFLGCVNCVDTWFNNHSTCPHCRSETGLETSLRISFLSSFLARCRANENV